MLKSIYSRIFFLCTIILLFACALTGLIIVLYANHLHEDEAYQSIDSTARIIVMRMKELYSDPDDPPDENELRAELETYTLNENIDCYLFDADGSCTVRSDYSAQPITLSAAMRDAASSKPYYRMGGSSGNFSEPTATYIERCDLGSAPYYLMMIVPVYYVSEFSAKLLVVLIIAVLVTGIVGAVLFYLNTTQLLKPVLNITRAAEAYAKGDFSARLKETGDSELDYLATTMNRMADFIDKNERSRKRFVSDISHELKTPMTTIGGFVDNILDGTIPPEQERHYLKIVSSEVQRMSRMVHSMLNISRFEEGTMALKLERFDLTHLLIKTLLLFEKKVDAKGVSVEGLEACPRTVAEADKDLMQQVFYNLTENAIKFVNKGGTLFLAVDSDDKQAHVHLRNSGEGLTEDEISHVFERFYKTDESRGRDTTGVGLGLSIVSRIMVLHGGTVTVKSVKGEYTEFIVSLPLTQEKKPEEQKETV
ncbi:MAG: HAMP domain-containing histidine kinase [Oscillospiraceae bacterium]|nr:HAMP domain-containing histidine kinase [Oscillospiraceae bacterium]